MARRLPYQRAFGLVAGISMALCLEGCSGPCHLSRCEPLYTIISIDKGEDGVADVLRHADDPLEQLSRRLDEYYEIQQVALEEYAQKLELQPLIGTLEYEETCRRLSVIAQTTLDKLRCLREEGLSDDRALYALDTMIASYQYLVNFNTMLMQNKGDQLPVTDVGALPHTLWGKLRSNYEKAAVIGAERGLDTFIYRRQHFHLVVLSMALERPSNQYKQYLKQHLKEAQDYGVPEALLAYCRKSIAPSGATQ